MGSDLFTPYFLKSSKMTKIYKSKIRESLYLKNIITYEGKEEVITVSFTRSNMIGGKCSFATNDIKKQLAIEGTKEFKNGFIEVVSSEDAKEDQENAEEPKDESKEGLIELDATNKQIAIEQLISVVPAIAEEVTTSLKNAEIEAMANANGYTFPALKIS